MKFRLFQTLLVTAIIVTWGGTLQAISINNNTNYDILVYETTKHGNTYAIQINPHGTFSWTYTGMTSITLSACVGSHKTGCGYTVSCSIVSPSGQLTVNSTGNSSSPINASCST